MKNLRLSDLKTKRDTFFRNFGNINPENMSRDEMKYFVERSFDAIPKKLRTYIQEDRTRITNILTHSVIANGNNAKWDVYQAILANAKYQYEHSHDRTREYIYKALKEQRPDVYAKYNTYVYRLGESSANLFIKKGDLTQVGSVITVCVPLPPKTTGKVFYSELKVEFDFSGDAIIYAEMV